MLVNLPFSIYSTFVIEEKYGFNKTTGGTFVMDQLKTFILTAIMGAIILPVMLWIVANAGPALVPVLAGVSIGFLFIISLLVPTVIIPCFFKYSELDDGPLKDAIYREAERTEIPVSQIQVIDGSQRSSHSNAFVAGMLWFRKVVLFDTLIQQHSEEEIIAVINHELGHVHHQHIFKHLFMSALQLIIMFSVFGLILGNKGVLEAFGFNHTSYFLYLFIFSQLYIPVDFLTKFLSMYMVRRAEYQADAFAVRHNHGKALKSALINLYKRNKGALVADELFSALNHNHPTMVERLKAIDSNIKGNN